MNISRPSNQIVYQEEKMKKFKNLTEQICDLPKGFWGLNAIVKKQELDRRLQPLDWAEKDSLSSINVGYLH